MTKIVLYPTPVTLSKSVLWYIKRKRKKKKEKKERKKERSGSYYKKNIFKNKTSEINSSCQHSGQQLLYRGGCLKLYCT